MRSSIILFLLLTDLIIPILFSVCLAILFDYNLIYEILLIGLFSGSLLIIFTLIDNGYKDYYLKHFDQKLRIISLSWIKANSIILIYILIYIDNKIINPYILLIWLLFVPVIIISLKYFLKLLPKVLPKYNLVIIGNFYKFSDQEIKRLLSKGYVIDFYRNHNDIDKEYNVKSSLFVINFESYEYLKDFSVDDKKYIYIDNFMESYLRRLCINSCNEKIILDLKDDSLKNYLIKRFFDYTMFIALSPLLLLVSILTFVFISFQSPGALIFEQSRVGHNGIKFLLKKFRTMHEESKHSLYTEDNDDRIYAYGRFLRLSRLDELPQLYNVLLGHMHFTGPRPEWDLLVNQYTDKIKYYNFRSVVRPGVTGWGSVMFGYASNIDDAAIKLTYELYYIKNWSIWLEIEIIIRTILIVLYKEGK